MSTLCAFCNLADGHEGEHVARGAASCPKVVGDINNELRHCWLAAGHSGLCIPGRVVTTKHCDDCGELRRLDRYHDCPRPAPKPPAITLAADRVRQRWAIAMRMAGEHGVEDVTWFYEALEREEARHAV